MTCYEVKKKREYSTIPEILGAFWLNIIIKVPKAHKSNYADFERVN